MEDYRNFIGKNDLNIIDNHFKLLILMIDLHGYDIWIFYPSKKKIEKDYKFNKSVGNLIFLNRCETSQNGKEYISNTIVELGSVCIFYGKAPKKILNSTQNEKNITHQQKQRFIEKFKKKL
jgi:hypothetical protein